jgi:hypothetical protein
VDALDISHDLTDVFTAYYDPDDNEHHPYDDNVEGNSNGDDNTIHGTFELGDGDGFTACLSAGFELLQLTARTNVSCGVVFARGAFPDSPQAFLARGQKEGPSCGFGLRVRKTRLVTAGYLNHRWPIAKESVENEDGEVVAEVITCWYIDQGTFVQVTKMSPTKKYGSVAVTYNMGSRIRFGCCCSMCFGGGRRCDFGASSTAFNLLRREYEHSAKVSHEGRPLTVADPALGAILYMQRFRDGKPVDFDSGESSGIGNVNVTCEDKIILTERPVVVVNTCSLRGSVSDIGDVFFEVPPSMIDVEKNSRCLCGRVAIRIAVEAW